MLRRLLRGALPLSALVLCCSCARPPASRPAVAPTDPTMPRLGLVPAPASTVPSSDPPFAVVSTTTIVVEPANDDTMRIGRELAALIAPAIDRLPDVGAASAADGSAPVILLTLTAGGDAASEGYELIVKSQGIQITADAPAGLFYGMQTLRQLLPASVEYRAARPHVMTVPAVRITDRPRFAWRGAMLDVARHFRSLDDVRRFIDLMALYKLNRLHLHLADDQGWRIEIKSWPNLTTHGGSTQVGGGPGGFYTQAQYGEIVAYARNRHIVVVPEIDMPGHTNAALASYPELNCSGVAPPLYTGIKVGFSALCPDKDVTYKFVDDVVREIAAITPGPYFHLGGDEVEKIPAPQYVAFIERVQAIVQAHGKSAIGWDEVAAARLPPGSLVQHWRPKASKFALPEGVKMILSPGNRLYLDMKYDKSTALGLNWAGFIDVRTAYDWEPATTLAGVDEALIQGIEAPLWSETIGTMRDVEQLAFPRLAAVAEVAWTPAAGRTWEAFRERLGAHAPRFRALGVNFFPDRGVPWQ